MYRHKDRRCRMRCWNALLQQVLLCPIKGQLTDTAPQWLRNHPEFERQLRQIVQQLMPEKVPVLTQPEPSLPIDQNGIGMVVMVFWYMYVIPLAVSGGVFFVFVVVVVCVFFVVVAVVGLGRLSDRRLWCCFWLLIACWSIWILTCGCGCILVLVVVPLLVVFEPNDILATLSQSALRGVWMGPSSELKPSGGLVAFIPTDAVPGALLIPASCQRDGFATRSNSYNTAFWYISHIQDIQAISTWVWRCTLHFVLFM